MTPLYWVEGLHEYDRELFKSGREKFTEYIEPIALEYKIKIEYLHIRDLFFGYSKTPHIYHKGEDILQNKGFVFIPPSNPHPQTDQLFHSLARIVNMSSNWKMINTPFPVDRNKEQIFKFASLINADTIPSWFIPERTASRSHVSLIEKNLGPYPYIVKPAAMLAGIGVIKIDNQDSFYSLMDYCSQASYTYLIQPFIKNAVDYRVYLEKHEVIACQKRSPPPHGFLANVSQRGTGEAILIDGKIEAYSKALAKHLTDGYLCVDWLVTEDKIFLSEIEFCGMFFGLPAPERTRVIHAFFRSILSKSK